jgi:hypothetical protein
MRIWVLLASALLLLVAVGNSCAVVIETEETIAYDVVNGEIGPESALARVWRGGGDDWSCNMNHKVMFNVYASMAQWMEAYVSATDIYWRILKPGDYAMDTIQIEFTSNGDVDLHVQDISPLENDEGDIIPTKWAITDKVWNGSEWVPVQPLPDDWFDEISAPPSTTVRSIPEDEEHEPIHLAVWNRVTPHDSDSACEYAGYLHLDFLLAEQKPWVDTATGEFDPEYPAPPPYPG